MKMENNKNNKINNKNKYIILINNILCKIKFHKWITKAYAKKNGKHIKIQKCQHCGLDRYK